MHSQTYTANIWQTALEECEAMVDHAFASGMEIPAELMTLLQNISNHELVTSNSKAPISEAIEQYLPQSNAQQLTLLHNKLSAIVAPATPRTLLLMRKQTSILLMVPLTQRMKHLIG